VRDLCVRRLLSISVGPVPTGQDVVQQLELTARARGGYPLAMLFDNGGANRAEVVQEHLAAEQVVVLWNLPYTPEHNAWTERGIEDVKAAAGLLRAERLAAEATEGSVSSVGARRLVEDEGPLRAPGRRVGASGPVHAASGLPGADARGT